jgi:hypothetical protein
MEGRLAMTDISLVFLDRVVIMDASNSTNRRGLTLERLIAVAKGISQCYGISEFFLLRLGLHEPGTNKGRQSYGISEIFLLRLGPYQNELIKDVKAMEYSKYSF